MTEKVLDENFEGLGVNQIPDRVLCEIKLSQKKYPKNVIKIVNHEIKSRNLAVSNYISKENFDLKVSTLNWIKSNRKLSILALITVMFSVFVGTIFTGLIASITVLISVYASIEVNQLLQRRIWMKGNLFVTILIIITMVLSFIINKYAV